MQISSIQINSRVSLSRSVCVSHIVMCPPIIFIVVCAGTSSKAWTFVYCVIVLFMSGARCVCSVRVYHNYV